MVYLLYLFYLIELIDSIWLVLHGNSITLFLYGLEFGGNT